jgi:hypothetical protein
VVRHITDDAGKGMGIKLFFEDRAQRDSYVEALGEIEALLLTGSLPTELLH